MTYRRRPPRYNRDDHEAFGHTAEWDRRGAKAIPPLHTCRFETENHHAYINMQIRPEHRNPQSMQKLSAEIFPLTGHKLVCVQEIGEDTIERCLYQAQDANDLTPDAGAEFRLRITVNCRDVVSFIIPPSYGDKIGAKHALLAVLRKYFVDSLGKPIVRGIPETRADTDLGKEQRKERHHRRYETPHSEAPGSPIEEMLAAEMTRCGIVFTPQPQSLIDEKLFTRPDFLVEELKLIIYCDGFEFHATKERIIRDKQQDRVLQINGFRVFRFSGSEIVADVNRCVRDVLELKTKG